MLGILSGGTGTPKLIQGLVRLMKQEELSIVVNTGEDLEISGLDISPDIDTTMYALAGIVNEETWYGIRGDTFKGHERYRREGKPELLKIGDRDREVKRRRTELLKNGMTLSKATRELYRSFGVEANIIPMSDDRVQTRIYTEEGSMSFNEFWVARRAKDSVTAVTFEGVEIAEPSPGVLDVIDNSEAILVGPSNPITSIGPILAVKGIKTALEREREKVTAVSPIVGKAPVSGPAGVLMEGLGHEVSPVGVARIYRDFVSTLVIDKRDEWLGPQIQNLDVAFYATDLLMPELKSRIKLANVILSLLGNSSKGKLD